MPEIPSDGVPYDVAAPEKQQEKALLDSMLSGKTMYIYDSSDPNSPVVPLGIAAEIAMKENGK